MVTNVLFEIINMEPVAATTTTSQKLRWKVDANEATVLDRGKGRRDDRREGKACRSEREGGGCKLKNTKGHGYILSLLLYGGIALVFFICARAVADAATAAAAARDETGTSRRELNGIRQGRRQLPPPDRGPAVVDGHSVFGRRRLLSLKAVRAADAQGGVRVREGGGGTRAGA